MFQVVDMQTQYLNSLLATAPQWGLSIDSERQPSGNAGKPSRNMLPSLRQKHLISLSLSAWTMFASAFVSDSTVRDALINSTHNHANSNLSLGAFPEIYNTSDNSYKNGVAG